ncbi:high choriolytic enzyme 1-like [Corythoichthys intestinalis]|uniref:high choriolytic enzyme 1-like n=1 Tax=Corythoichthys intestinalis TaxID=161448 RepID=UPI0025A55657|nr:high choriolytic enzyme 1-like [Corythoichthys intestinalis]
MDNVGISDSIARANVDTTKLLTHGDIVPNLQRNADPCTNSGCKWTKQGRYVYVPVTMSSEFSKCWSYLGRQPRGQPISLQKRGCVHHGIVQHEVLHALGLHHEQVRSDRDEHVNILFENIMPGAERNFEKVNTNNLGTPYDFDSIMHYSKFAFSKNNQPTIVAKMDPDRLFGLSTEMTGNDTARVNALYECGLNPVSQLVNKTGYPYRLKNGATVTILYMDDLKLYCKSERDIDSMSHTTRIYSGDIGMSFGLEKCGRMVTKSVGISEAMIPEIAEMNKSYRWLERAALKDSTEAPIMAAQEYAERHN